MWRGNLFVNLSKDGRNFWFFEVKASKKSPLSCLQPTNQPMVMLLEFHGWSWEELACLSPVKIKVTVFTFSDIIYSQFELKPRQEL
jgi:hypothetical protein